jgi:hypothetical protein
MCTWADSACSLPTKVGASDDSTASVTHAGTSPEFKPCADRKTEACLSIESPDSFTTYCQVDEVYGKCKSVELTECPNLTTTNCFVASMTYYGFCDVVGDKCEKRACKN